MKVYVVVGTASGLNVFQDVYKTKQEAENHVKEIKKKYEIKLKILEEEI